MRRGAVSTTVIAALCVALGAGGAIAFHATPEAPAPQVTTHGEWVKVANTSGDSIRAYVAFPERRDKAPAIIVIHEIFGLTEWEPTMADRLAAAGYVAIAPDLLSPRFGVTPASTDSGRKLTALLDPAAVIGDLDAIFGYLNTLPAVRPNAIGTIGFCWGGARSFRYATTNPLLQAAVVCYGSAPDSAAMTGIKAKVLGVYGEDDARINQALPDVERQMRAAQATFRYKIYPGTGHGFFRPGRKGADSPAATEAWEDVLAFYKATFR